MKRNSFIIFVATLFILVNEPKPTLAQAPLKISYQAVVRNGNNELVTNTAVGMRITLLQTSITGNTVYQETHQTATNSNGLVTVEIGSGVVTAGTFSGINWATGPYFIKTESDISGGTNYSITGTQQLLSVPYALYAESSGNSSVLTNLSVASANGFAGVVTNPSTAPVIELRTPVMGIIKGNGTAMSAATAGDFPILNQNTTGRAATVTTNANLIGPVTSVGNATAIGDGVITAAMLSTVNSNVGTFNNLTVNAKGLVTAASNTTYEVPLTFSTGLTRTANTITNNLSIGKAGSQSVIGGTGASETLTLSSTSNATKGKILFGTSAYSEFNNRLGIGTQAPSTTLDVNGTLRVADGTQGAGKVLTSDATGVATWQTPTSGSASGWSLTGNAGTSGSSNFIGTTDNVPLGIRVNNLPSGKIDASLHNTSFGYRSGFSNTTGALNAFFGEDAGYSNTSGQFNTGVGLNALRAITTGGYNTALGSESLQSCVDGIGNTAIGCLVFRHGLGSYNTALGFGAFDDVAYNSYVNSTAIGANADITASNNMVFGDGNVVGWGFGAQPGSAAIRVGSNATNGNGATLTVGGTWTNASDRNKKENFSNLNSAEILSAIKQLPISRWNYKGENPSVTHIGPMAQDFYKLFNVGNDDRSISTIDPSGVALVGIQELVKENEELHKTVNKLLLLIDKMKQNENDIKAQISSLQSDYETRLKKLEETLSGSAKK